MLKMLLRIDLSDQGSFFSTENVRDLKLYASIKVLYGTTDYTSSTKNLFPNMITNYTPTQNDTFFFAPGVVIPRVKLKDIYTTHGIKSVRNPSSANRIFVGAKTMDKLLDTQWFYLCETKSFLDFITYYYESGNLDEYDYNKLKDALEFYTEAHVLCTSFTTGRILQNQRLPYQIHSDCISGYNRSVSLLDEEHQELYEYIKDLVVYDETSLAPYINGPDAIVIDAQVKETLASMLGSSDNENWTVAMEIMANCNYEESLLYLVDLLYDYGSRIETMPSKNHVNFKTLATYLGLRTNDLDINKDEAIKILVDKNAVTSFNMQYFLDKFKKDVTYSKYFTVKAVTYTEEIDKLLKEELISTIKEDYKPEPEPEYGIDNNIFN